MKSGGTASKTFFKALPRFQFEVDRYHVTRSMCYIVESALILYAPP